VVGRDVVVVDDVVVVVGGALLAVVDVVVVVLVVVVDVVVVVVACSGSVSSLDRELSVPSLAYAVAAKTYATDGSSPATRKLIVPSAAGVGSPASCGVPKVPPSVEV